MAEVIDFYELKSEAVAKEVEREQKEIREAKEELKEVFEEAVLTICEFLYENENWTEEIFQEAIDDLKESITNWEKIKKELELNPT